MDFDSPLLPEYGSPEALILYVMAEKRRCCAQDVGLERNLPLFLAALDVLRKLGWAIQHQGSDYWGEMDPEYFDRPEVDAWCDGMATSIRAMARNACPAFRGPERPKASHLGANAALG